MLRSVVETMAKKELGEIESFLNTLMSYSASAKRLATVEAARSGIQSHSVGEKMWKELEPRRVTLWRVRAVAHCETELAKIVALLVASGDLDGTRDMVDRCESRLVTCAHIVGMVMPDAASQKSKDSFARIARKRLGMQSSFRVETLE